MINEFEYLIIGGGSAGCRLAARLSAAAVGPIALVEAGASQGDVRTVVPQWYLRLFGSRFDWGYMTEPVPALQNRRFGWPRGKLLGGSGAVNALIYLQASLQDFTRWGWDWAEALVDRELLPHEQPLELHPWSQAFVSACQQQGLAVSHEFTQADANVAGAFFTTQRAGHRVHAGHGLPGDGSNNLTIVTNHVAERILWNRDRACGVELRDATGGAQHLHARREVILCCGAIGTPLLLMQSGIGPSDALHRLGVPCQLAAEGVGHNLQDHLAFPLIYNTQAPIGLRGISSQQQRNQYRQQAAGPLTSNLAETGCLFSLANERDQPTAERPIVDHNNTLRPIDAQLHFTPTHYLKFPRGTRKAASYCTLAVSDLHPSSLGCISPVSADGHRIQVAIQPNYLSTERDWDRLLAAIRFARELAEQPALQAVVDSELLPGSKRQTDEAVRRSVQAYALSIYHPVGTCRMESSEERPTPAVVDRQFRLLGAEGLRIADASILPDLPSCNTNAVTMLLAERLADLLAN